MSGREAVQLHLVSGADEAYFPGLLATVCSALIHLNEECDVCLYVFDGGLSLESRDCLEKRANRICRRIQIEWLAADLSQFEDLPPLNGNFMSYARLLVPSLIDSSRAIWLDSDLLVLRDLSPLASLDLGGRLVGACPESLLLTVDKDISNPEQFGIPNDAVYFNAGLLVMDLAGLREFDFIEKSLRFLDDYRGNYHWHDQSAINVVLYDKVFELEPLWNVQNMDLMIAQDASVMDEPMIFHFLQHPKPWQRYQGGFFSDLFYDLLRQVGRPKLCGSGMRREILKLKWRLPRLTKFYFRLRLMFSYNARQRELNQNFMEVWEYNAAVVKVTANFRQSYARHVARFARPLDCSAEK